MVLVTAAFSGASYAAPTAHLDKDASFYVTLPEDGQGSAVHAGAVDWFRDRESESGRGAARWMPVTASGLGNCWVGLGLLPQRN